MGNFTRLLPTLLSHQWKESVRSSYMQKSILINIVLGIFLLYFLVNLVVLGLFLGKIMRSAFPGADPASALSGIMLYYFMADFLLRFLLQPTPVLSVMPYLHLPVRKNSLYHYLLLKSAFSVFNFLPLVVLLPFTIGHVAPDHSPVAGISWIITFILLILAANYLGFYFKKMFAVRPWVIVVPVMIAAGITWVDISLGRMISQSFGKAVMFVALNPGWMIVPLTLFILSYVLSWNCLHRHRYLEIKEKAGKTYGSEGHGRTFSQVFGVKGSLVLLELKMILRNNRPRTYLVLSVLFMFYGFMIYRGHNLPPGDGTTVFAGLLLTGIMMIQYGQLILSWESVYFDRLCTANFTILDYFTAKFWLFFIFNTAAFLVTAPYALFGYRILIVNLAAWLFNCGINIFVILFLGTMNTKRVDMSKGAFFNYEGVSAVHFILIIPVLGFPLLIYWLAALASSSSTGILILGLAGMAGLLFHRQFISIIARQFLSRKQKILHGFRNG